MVLRLKFCILAAALVNTVAACDAVDTVAVDTVDTVAVAACDGGANGDGAASSASNDASKLLRIFWICFF